MKVLVDCEASQTVCIEFRKRGHEAYSCDLLDPYGGYPEWHIKGDALQVLHSQSWDLVIAHPPCTRLANSGVRWLVSNNPRQGYHWSEPDNIYIRSDESIWQAHYEACRFFNAFIEYGRAGNKLSTENPIQHKYARFFIPGPSQIIHPWQFGHTTSKATCLWNFHLPDLKPTDIIPKDRRTQDIWLCPPGPDRQKIRSKTFQGIAKAMAEQWG